MKLYFALFWMFETRVGLGGQTPVQRLTLPTPTDHQWARAFIDGGRGLHAEIAQSTLTVILKLVIGGLTSIILIVCSRVSLQFQGQLVSISWGQVSKLWPLMSWLQSSHRVVNFFHLEGFQYRQDSSQDMAQTIIYSL